MTVSQTDFFLVFVAIYAWYMYLKCYNLWGKVVWKESELELVSVKPHAGVNDGMIDDMNDIEPTYEIVNGTFPVAEIYILIKQIIW